jgi:hypothetical protein
MASDPFKYFPTSPSLDITLLSITHFKMPLTRRTAQTTTPASSWLSLPTDFVVFSATIITSQSSEQLCGEWQWVFPRRLSLISRAIFFGHGDTGGGSHSSNTPLPHSSTGQREAGNVALCSRVRRRATARPPPMYVRTTARPPSTRQPWASDMGQRPAVQARAALRS